MQNVLEMAHGDTTYPAWLFTKFAVVNWWMNGVLLIAVPMTDSLRWRLTMVVKGT